MWMSYAAIGLAIVIVGGVGGKATDVGPWYRELKKPTWNPPDWMFPVAWTTIYLFIIAAVGGVWNVANESQQLLILCTTAVNLVLNLFWSVVFFSWRKPQWALIEVALLWLSIVAMMIVFFNVDQRYGLLLLPYLAWVSVASVLNLRIVQLNPALT